MPNNQQRHLGTELLVAITVVCMYPLLRVLQGKGNV